MKNTIIGLIIGVSVTVTVLAVWQTINLQNRVSVLENATAQIVQFINNASKATTK